VTLFVRFRAVRIFRAKKKGEWELPHPPFPE
jgi:hypothetical protein